MQKQKIINLGLLVITLFAVVSCNTKNSALRIKADQKNATVIIDGKEVGEAPLDIMVSKGKHLIEVYKETSDGRFYDLKQLEIAENVAKSVNLHLIPNAGSFVDERDNCLYKTVKIGDQIWMAENLKYLPSVNKFDDGSKTEAKYYVYGYKGTNLDSAKQSSNYEIYGVLYNWTAAQQSCPAGWHLPSDAEWKKLEMELGMSKAEVDKYGYRGTNEGSKLAGNADLWKNGDLKENSKFGKSGFTALPDGYRNFGGSFYLVGYRGSWWSATEFDSNYAYYRNLRCNYSDVFRYNLDKDYGFSVRCVRDN